MKKIKIANCALEASEIALGCMRISEMSDQEISTLIHTALDEGINFFDHADIYGGGTIGSEVRRSLAYDSEPARKDDPAKQVRHPTGIF